MPSRSSPEGRREAAPSLSTPEPLKRQRSASDVRDTLAPGQSEAQLRLANGTPLTGWISSPEAFDLAVAEALKQYPREEIRVHHEQAL